MSYGKPKITFFVGALAVNCLPFQSILVPCENERAPWSSSDFYNAVTVECSLILIFCVF